MPVTFYEYASFYDRRMFGFDEYWRTMRRHLIFVGRVKISGFELYYSSKGYPLAVRGEGNICAELYLLPTWPICGISSLYDTEMDEKTRETRVLLEPIGGEEHLFETVEIDLRERGRTLQGERLDVDYCEPFMLVYTGKPEGERIESGDFAIFCRERLGCEVGQVYHFAYGSNMNPERLVEKGIPHIGWEPAYLENYELIFNKPSADGTTRANIIARKGSRVVGCLYTLRYADLFKLDGTEPGYVRRTVRVKTLNGGERFAEVYIATQTVEPKPPPAHYLRHLVKGLRLAGWFDEARTLESHNLG